MRKHTKKIIRYTIFTLVTVLITIMIYIFVVEAIAYTSSVTGEAWLEWKEIFKDKPNLQSMININLGLVDLKVILSVIALFLWIAVSKYVRLIP